jgi:hypothetical protein
VAALAILAGFYTILGGLKAVIYTDAMQGVLLVVGSIVITLTAWSRIGGWREVVAGVPAEKLSLIRPVGDPGVPWPGLLRILVDKGLIGGETVRNLLTWRHSGFSVHGDVRVKDRQGAALSWNEETAEVSYAARPTRRSGPRPAQIPLAPLWR